MSIKAYSFADKKKQSIKSGIKTSKYQLPNGNTVTIICGKTKNMNVVCTIVSNEKMKPCKNGAQRSARGARCIKK